MTEDEICVVLKTETDVPATRIICLTLLDLDTGKINSFSDQPGYTPIAEAVALLPYCDRVISHSDYHIKKIAKFYGVRIDPDRFFDTLALAKVAFPNIARHKLDDWGPRLRIARKPFRGAATWTRDASEHCDRDARIVARLYQEILDNTPDV